jgi:hypothetical protein
VVFGDLDELRVAAQVVGAGVADVREDGRGLGPQHCHQRGSHARQSRVRVDLVAYSVVGFADRPPEDRSEVGRIDLAVMVLQRFDHCGAGDVAGDVAAETVRDRKQGSACVDGVFVALAHEPDVGAGGGFNGEGTLVHLPVSWASGPAE